MPQKPGRYGILIRAATDAKTRYVFNLIPYGMFSKSLHKYANFGPIQLPNYLGKAEYFTVS